MKIVKQKKISGKIIGGYYPYNYEMNILEILKKFEEKKYLISLPKIKKKYRMDFYKWSTKKDPLRINKYGIPEPIKSKPKTPFFMLNSFIIDSVILFTLDNKLLCLPIIIFSVIMLLFFCLATISFIDRT